MLRAYLLLLKNWVGYYLWLWVKLPAKRPVKLLYNLIILLLWPLLLVLLHVHWLFFLVDELLFWGYRRVAVNKPLFVTGVPRSGTTFLQRTLSEDAQFTTTTLAECLLTPAISQRYLALLLAPLLWSFKWLLARARLPLVERMASIHKLGLAEPEEGQ